MPTLILSHRYTEDSNKVWRAASDFLEWDVVRLQGYRIPDSLRKIDPTQLAFYGESLLGLHLEQELGLKLVRPEPAWLPNLPHKYRRRDILLTTFAEAKLAELPWFIKPADEKTFPAQVYRYGEKLNNYKAPKDDDLVLMSTPVNFESEYRGFILNRKLMTYSYYYGHDYDGINAHQLLLDLCADPEVSLPPAVVVDVGFDKDRGWMVIEANPAWGSGLYSGSPTQALRTIFRATQGY